MQKILLVEDDPALQFTVLTALEEKGYEVDAVSTTGEAIERLSGNAYPIVVSDIYIDERPASISWTPPSGRIRSVR